MMAKTKEPFIVFKTEEEYLERMDKFYEDGRWRGFKDGSIWTASYFYELIHDMFKPEAFVEMQKEITDRQIEAYRKEKDVSTLKQKMDNEKFIEKVKEVINSYEKEEP